MNQDLFEPANVDQLYQSTKNALIEFKAKTKYKEFTLYIDMNYYKKFSKEEWVRYKKNFPEVSVCIVRSISQIDYIVDKEGELVKV